MIGNLKVLEQGRTAKSTVHLGAGDGPEKFLANN